MYKYVPGTQLIYIDCGNYSCGFANNLGTGGVGLPWGSVEVGLGVTEAYERLRKL
jgi:hypothetical protein